MATLPYKKIPYLKCGNFLQYLEFLFKKMVSSLSSSISFARICTINLIAVRDRETQACRISVSFLLLNIVGEYQTLRKLSFHQWLNTFKSWQLVFLTKYPYYYLKYVLIVVNLHSGLTNVCLTYACYRFSLGNDFCSCLNRSTHWSIKININGLGIHKYVSASAK